MKKFIIITIIAFTQLVISAQNAFLDLAKSYAESGNFEEAIRLGAKGVEFINELSGSNNETYAVSLANLAYYHEQLGNVKEAIRLEQDAISILKHLPNPNQELITFFLFDLSGYYADNGDYKQAVTICKDCREKITEVYGKSDEKYFTCINNLAVYYSQSGDYENAFNIGVEILEFLKATIGEDTPYEISPLLIMANYYQKVGNYVEALNNAQKALKISLTFGEQSYESSRCLNLIAGIYDSLGDFHESIKFLEESIGIRKILEGEKSTGYVRAITNLSQIYAHAGSYKEAIDLANQAKDILFQILGENHPEYLNSLYSLSCLFQDLGNYKEAIPIFENVAIKRKEILGEYNPSYINALIGISTNCAYLKNFNEAIKIGLQVDSIIRLNSLENLRIYDTNLNNLSWYYSCVNQFEEAFFYANKTIEIRKRKLGENSLEYLKGLYSLSYLYYKQKNYHKAIEIETDLLNRIYEILGDTHPLYLDCIANLTVLSNYLNEVNLIELYAPNTLNKFRNQYLSYFSFLPSSERNNVWRKREHLFRNTFPQIAYSNHLESHPFASLAYDAILFSKGILLNSEMEFEKFLTNSGSSDLLEKYQLLKLLRSQRNKLYSIPISERYVDADSLTIEINELERQIMHDSYEYGDYTRNLTITWEDVKDNLKRNEAAIEFVSFSTTTDDTIYMAYILREGNDFPQIVKLFEEKDLILFKNVDSYKSKVASKMIWGKLNPYLEGVETVYFAPDGAMNQIAFEDLPDFDGEGLIADRYNLYRLSSTREIAINNREETTNEVAIYGGILYDTELSVMETESRRYYGDTSLASRSINSLIDSLGKRGGVRFLEHTKTEAEQICSMMNVTNGIACLFTGDTANEESFKNLSGKRKRIIHIATHGFYWDKDDAEYEVSLNDKLSFMLDYGTTDKRNTEDKVLTRTGLYMAGANNILKGKEIPDSIEDGILTAQEIANLDLRGLDLVVLSACQTGMGDISGDGVFGLQRGFKKAGANSILMSLWDVDDKATQLLMTEFYKNYLGGMSKQKSLKEAQRVVRETPGFEDPEYWAAFILLDGLN